MEIFKDALDNISSLIVDPLNDRRRTGSKILAFAVSIIFGILPFGLGILGSKKWRKYRNITENDTKKKISKLFQKILPRRDKGRKAIKQNETIKTPEMSTFPTAIRDQIKSNSISAIPAGESSESTFSGTSENSTFSEGEESPAGIAEEDKTKADLIPSLEEKKGDFNRKLGSVQYGIRKSSMDELVKTLAKGKKFHSDGFMARMEYSREKFAEWQGYASQVAMFMTFMKTRNNADSMVGEFDELYKDNEEILELCQKASFNQLVIIGGYYMKKISLLAELSDKELKKQQKFLSELLFQWHNRIVELNETGQVKTINR